MKNGGGSHFVGGPCCGCAPPRCWSACAGDPLGAPRRGEPADLEVRARCPAFSNPSRGQHVGGRARPRGKPGSLMGAGCGHLRHFSWRVRRLGWAPRLGVEPACTMRRLPAACARISAAAVLSSRARGASMGRLMSSRGATVPAMCTLRERRRRWTEHRGVAIARECSWMPCPCGPNS